MDSIVEELKNCMTNRQITRSVQTGFINVAITNLLAEFGEVYFYTPASFNPFEDNEKVNFFTEKEINVALRDFGKKHGTIDVLVLSGAEHYYEIRSALCASMPNIRINGVIAIANTDNEEVKKGIKDYVNQLGESALKVEHFDTFSILTVVE